MKLSESEAKLHKVEREKAQLLNQSCRMKMKLQEALEKYEHSMNERDMHVRNCYFFRHMKGFVTCWINYLMSSSTVHYS